MNPISENPQTTFQTKMEEQLYHQLGGVEHDLMMAQIRIEELQDVANHTKRHNDYLIIQNEELEAQNKILIETGHRIGQDEAYDLKVAVQEFLDMTRLGRRLDEETHVWEVPNWQMQKMAQALNNCKTKSD